MNPVLEKLLTHGPVLTDGAWGTQLQALGLQTGDFPDAWNATHPERVTAVARAYVEAGSRVILTNTFGANQIRMREQATGFTVAELNRKGVAISRQAAGNRARVF
ncbi:MAG TPA: homocysteine S-methyltransferase family protein, partial [Verrucomicrobiae bacterium]|nr:homocysteine S-methyltransferase family protein [Verrucomicrobiae bacterium]